MTDADQRNPRHLLVPAEPVEQDPSAKFAYDLATRPPIKDVASVKAASDIFDANPPEEAPSSPNTFKRSTSYDRKR